MFYNKKYKNRKTIDRQDHNHVVSYVIGIYTLLFLLVMVILGYVTRSKELIWPISRGQVQYIDKAYAVEVEKYVIPETVEQKIRATFKEDPETAVKVAKCESGLRPDAKNPNSSARGVFQIMQSWHRINEKWLLNEDVNIQVAYQLWQEQGWTPWEASRNCWGSK